MDNSRYAGTFEIVGVARDAKYTDPDQPARPMFFVPLEQRVHYSEVAIQSNEIQTHFVGTIQLLVRGDTRNLEPQLRKALADIDPNLTIITVRSMNEQVASNFDQQRMVAQLAGTFGVIALLLAAIGLYGLTAYTVACRTSEIGVRMALGADRLNIVRLVLRGAFLLVAIGLLIGIPLAIGAGRLMAAQLFEIRSWDPHVFGFSILALGICAAARQYFSRTSSRFDGSNEGAAHGLRSSGLIVANQPVGVIGTDATLPTGVLVLRRRKRFAGSEYKFATPAPNNAANRMAKTNKIGTPRMGLPA